MKIDYPKSWFEQHLALELDSEVGAGSAYFATSEHRIRLMAEIYGIRPAQLSKWIGTSDVNKKLEYLAQASRLFLVINEDGFRKWLRTKNPNLGDQTPLSWLHKGRWRLIAELVDDMLTGAPT